MKPKTKNKKDPRFELSKRQQQHEESLNRNKATAEQVAKEQAATTPTEKQATSYILTGKSGGAK